MIQANRLQRLLADLKREPADLALCKQAIAEAYGAGDTHTARLLIVAGLERTPRDRELLALCGFSNLREQRYAAAERFLAAAMAHGLRTHEVQHNHALSLHLQRRHADALRALQGAEPTVPTLLLRARCLYQLDRIDEASAVCRACLAAQPGQADAHGLLALMLYEQQQMRRARAHLEAALKRDPEQLEALIARGCLQAETRDFRAAEATFRALVAAHPQCVRGWRGLAAITIARLRADPESRSGEKFSAA